MASQTDISHQQNLLSIHRRTARHYQSQLSRLRDSAPPGVFAGIDETRREIDRIKKVLRGWSIETPDAPEDTATQWERELGVEL